MQVQLKFGASHSRQSIKLYTPYRISKIERSYTQLSM